MENIIITLDEDGIVRFLVNEETEGLVEDGVVRRASHVEPTNPILRRAFHALRSKFGEKGRVADFTRSWICEWRINLAPSGGGILSKTFWDRQDAINYEINYLNNNFI